MDTNHTLYIQWQVGVHTWLTMNISSNLKRKKFKDFKYKNLLASYVAGICNVLTVTPLSVIST